MYDSCSPKNKYQVEGSSIVILNILAAFLFKVPPEAFSAIFIQIIVKSLLKTFTSEKKSIRPKCGTNEKVVNRLCCVLNGIRRNCLLVVDGHMEYTVFGLEKKMQTQFVKMTFACVCSCYLF
jgi:flagellar motor component MotA